MPHSLSLVLYAPLQDFEAIGINKRGFRLRLQMAAKKLPSLPIHTDVPVGITLPIGNYNNIIIIP